MVSFSMGLMLLMSGFTFYKLANVIVAPTISPAGVWAPDTAKSIAGFLNVPGFMAPYIPYIGVAVMALGFIWFWLIKLMMYLSVPSKKDKGIVY